MLFQNNKIVFNATEVIVEQTDIEITEEMEKELSNGKGVE